jgi:putative salt-induced outer membrane protein YdiY
VSRRLLALLPALAVWLAAAPARAQVNVETFRSDLETRPRVLMIQAGYTGHLGNVNGSVASLGAFAGITFLERHLAFAKFQGDYAEFSGKPTVAKAFGHARYNYRFLPWLWGEVFVQIEENQFQRLALRQVDGLGPRFGIVQRPDFGLFYGTGWMLDYEKLSDQPGTFAPYPGPRWWAQRWNNYVAVSWKLSARARLSDTLYVQPRWSGFSDVRLLNDAAFTLEIDKRFSAKIDCMVHHNSLPPAGVLPTDVDTLTSLQLTLP